MSSKDSLKNLSPQLFNSRSTAELSLVKEWLQASIEDVKNRMLTVDPADVRGLQGEARGYNRLLRTITEKPLHVDD